jgi:hypothetical protein
VVKSPKYCQVARGMLSAAAAARMPSSRGVEMAIGVVWAKRRAQSARTEEVSMEPVFQVRPDPPSIGFFAED